MIKQLPSAAGVIVYQDHGPGNLFFLGLISLPEFQRVRSAFCFFYTVLHSHPASKSHPVLQAHSV